MTRKLLTDFNTRPYYDDFDIDKNFLRVLFKPGTALQAREVTQLQTIINEQISRFGNHIFKDGSPVLEGSFNVDVNVKYIKLHQEQDNVDISTYLSDLENRILTNNAANDPVRFLVRKAIVNTSSEPNTLIGVYLSGGDEVLSTGGTVLTTEPEDSKPIRTVTVATPGLTQFVGPSDVIKGPSSIASVNEGVFYISGFFTRTENQTIVLNKYDNTPTYRIGLEVEESIITAADDSSLYDNAQGSSNFSAPGADRFKISLTLTKNQLDAAAGNLITNNSSCEFYEFVRVRNGQKVDQVKNAQYSYLGEEMARRTYDANGDFVVKNFTLDIDEDNTDDNKLVVTLDSGKAYVQGREIETISPVSLSMDKGRDTSSVSEENVSTFVGNFVYITFPASLSGEIMPNIHENDKLDVYNATTKIGTCRIKQLSHDSNGYKLSIFDLQITSGSSKDIVSFKNEGGTNNVFVVSSVSRVDGVTSISQQERNPLLFPISKSSVESISDVSFYYNRFEEKVPSYAAGNSYVSVSVSGSGDEFLLSPNPSGPEYSYATEPNLVRNNFIIINKDTGENYPNFNVTVTDTSSATLEIVGVNLSSATVQILYKVQANVGNVRAKSLQTSSPIIFNAGTELADMKMVGTPVTLDGYYDVTELVSIVGDVSGDITDRYELDNGQRDTFYDFASVKLKSGVDIPTDSSFTIIVKSYIHSGTGFFTKDSYSGIDYQNIPIYFSKSSGKSYSLSDVIDFRPTRQIGDTIDGGRIPYGAPADFLEVSYSYYMPRIDKIVLTKDKEFRVIKGTSSDVPVTPPDDPNAMSLYIITVPPYTYNDNDLKVVPIHNRRYTMRDIGILDRRIEELQARSNLRLLQEKSKNVQIRDASGNDIFKNGVLIDDFSGHSIGDINSSDYRCSIDFETNELRPSFYSSSHDVSFDLSSSTNIVKSGPLLLLEHDEVLHQIQPLSSKSINLNPHQMTYWFGEIKMDPSSDMWFSQDLKPRVNINDSGENNAWENLSQTVSSDIVAGFGTQWNDWEDIWTGRETFISNQEVDPSSLVESNIVRLQSREAQNYLFDVVDKIGSISAGLPNRIEKEITNKKVDTSVVPFMREDQVTFIATNLKPKTVFHAFFDDSELSSPYVEPCKKLTITDPSKVFIDGIYDGEIITGLSGGQVKVVKNANDGSGLIYVKEISGTLSADEIINSGTSLIQATVKSYETPTELKSDSAGQLCGVLNIPSEESKKFRTGQRLFRLIDNNTNDLSLTESLAESAYISQGLLGESESYINSTRNPISKRSNICDELSLSRDVYSRELYATNRCLDWKDPLSQTFIIDGASNRNGVFLKSVDLFFKSKDALLPVMIEIRPTVNGYPSTSSVIPFSEVILNPSQVVISSGPDPEESSNKNTRFHFDAPVYLTPGEYAIVIKTNSSKYDIWSSSVGETVLNVDGTPNILNSKVTKQPLVGSLFSSHNAGTWQQLNNESIMFRLNKCQFQSSQEGSAVLNVSVPAQVESFDLFKFNASMLKNFFEVQNPNFQYEIGNETAVNFHENRNIELSLRKSIGGATGFKITSTFPASSDTDVSPVIDMERVSLITVRNIVDNVEYDVSDLTIENAGSGYTNSDTLKITDINDSTKTATFAIQVDGSGGITGFTLLSSSSNMTNGVSYQINSSTGDGNAVIIIDSETQPSGSVADAVYVSKRVNLKSPYESKDLRVYLDLYKPSGTNVNVYYKVGNSNDSVIFDDRNWYLMTQITPEYVVSEYNNDYREYVFGTNGGVELVNDGTLDNFNIYSIKIVLSSSSGAKVSKARNLRAIALQEPAGV